MKRSFNPYIIPATCMMIVLLVAISLFYRHSEADNRETGITVEEAKSIALADAKEKGSHVTFTKASLDRDSGVDKYEVEFYTDTTEYDYEINASTGSIMEKETKALKTRNSVKNTAEKNTESKAAKNTGKTSDVIGVDRAKKLVLKASGYGEKEVTFTEADLETSDGKLVYDIKFLRKGQEYEYEVDAYSGEILEWDVDAEDSRDIEDADDDQDDDNDLDDDRDDDDDDQDDDHDDDDDDHDDDDDDDHDDDQDDDND